MKVYVKVTQDFFMSVLILTYYLISAFDSIDHSFLLLETAPSFGFQDHAHLCFSWHFFKVSFAGTSHLPDL